MWYKLATTKVHTTHTLEKACMYCMHVLHACIACKILQFTCKPLK